MIVHGFEAFTEPEVGMILTFVFDSKGTIQSGRAEPSANVIDVKEPVVAHALAAQARMAGLEVYALAFTEGRLRVKGVVEPTAAVPVAVEPLSHGYRLQLQAGVVTVTTKVVVTDDC